MKTVAKVNAERQGQFSMYLVKVNGVVVGMLEKYRDQNGLKQPWKAYRGVGFARVFLGAFYPEQGGKNAALAAI